MSGLLDKVVLITGASRGTGRTHCVRFAGMWERDTWVLT